MTEETFSPRYPVDPIPTNHSHLRNAINRCGATRDKWYSDPTQKVFVRPAVTLDKSPTLGNSTMVWSGLDSNPKPTVGRSIPELRNS